MTQTPEQSARSESSAPSPKERSGGVVLEMPGAEPASWERWHYPQEGEPTRIAEGDALPKKSRRVIALPSSALYSWPLWIAAEGDASELVKLELSGRHLLKRGMEDSLAVLPILQLEGRRLVLAIALEEPFPAEAMPRGWKHADIFEIPSRLHEGASGSDLILWKEWNTIQLAFYRSGKLLWFCGAGEQDLPALVQRVSLRLLSENVLDRLPATIRIEGMNPEVTATYASELGKIFPEADIQRVLIPPPPWWGEERRTRSPRRRALPPGPPHRPGEPFDSPPAEAVAARTRRKTKDRLLSIATAATLIYALLLFWGAGDLLIHRHALKKLRLELSSLEAPALQARHDSERWNALRSAIDPTTYPLDLLAAVASPTQGGKIRLIAFNMESGHLQISGEATDVTQAYSFIEQLKKNSSLREYDWHAGQPQLAGKNSVKFDVEGAHPNASQ